MDSQPAECGSKAGNQARISAVSGDRGFRSHPCTNGPLRQAINLLRQPRRGPLSINPPLQLQVVYNERLDAILSVKIRIDPFEMFAKTDTILCNKDCKHFQKVRAT